MRVKGWWKKALLHVAPILGKLLKRALPKNAGAPPSECGGDVYGWDNDRMDFGKPHDIREQANRAKRRRSKSHGLDS